MRHETKDVLAIIGAGVAFALLAYTLAVVMGCAYIPVTVPDARVERLVVEAPAACPKCACGKDGGSP